MDIANIRRQKIRELIDEKFGGNQSAFARQIGRQADYVSRILSGRRGVGEELARDIERKLNLPALWLDGATNVEPGPYVRGFVPLISWVQAGHWSEVIDNFQPGDAEEWLPCPVPHGPRTFVLRVRGESMFNPYGRPSFQEGDLIFVDPDREPTNGSLVVVRLDDSKEAMFKKLVIEGDKCYLRALNPAWPEPIIPIDEDATICGTVIFKGEKL